MAETGHLASECGLHEEAERIFCHLVTARPGNPSPLIALAIVRSCAGRMDQAIDDIREVAAAHPDSEMAKAVLGMFLSQARRPEADELFGELLANGKDPAAIQVARLCMKDEIPVPATPASESLEYFRHYNVRP
jgi:predicted Zn-dependent protease